MFAENDARNCCASCVGFIDFGVDECCSNVDCNSTERCDGDNDAPRCSRGCSISGEVRLVRARLPCLEWICCLACSFQLAISASINACFVMSFTGGSGASSVDDRADIGGGDRRSTKAKITVAESKNIQLYSAPLAPLLTPTPLLRLVDILSSRNPIRFLPSGRRFGLVLSLLLYIL